jgi:hypothetical protein
MEILMENNEIDSKWFALTADWDNNTEKFVNHCETQLPNRIIKMKIFEQGDPDKKILKFIDAPTGYESYYINDLIKTIKLNYNEDLCICAGTTNSWHRCCVKWGDVVNYLKKENCM